MDTFTKAFFSIFMIVWGILSFSAYIHLRRKTAVKFGVLRFWSVVPLALYGPIVVLFPWYYFGPGHLHPGYKFLVRILLAKLVIVTPLTSRQGIWLPIWPLVSSFIANQCKKNGSMDDWSSSQRSRGPFYILIVDLALIATLMMDACRYPMGSARSAWTFDSDLGKLMRIFVILLFASRDAMLVPIASFPRTIGVPAVLVTRFIFSGRFSRAERRQPDDLESLLADVAGRRRNTLAVLVKDDRIAQGIASNLHYGDLVNLSLASKLTRRALFDPSPDPSSRQDRIESLCVSSCVNGKKSECWACERVICEKCKVQRETLQSSRVKNHFTYCYAVCTICYLLSAPGGAAPFQAKWNMKDLELQHVNCCQFQWPQSEGSVDLCPHCSALDDAAVTAKREAKDAHRLRQPSFAPGFLSSFTPGCYGSKADGEGASLWKAPISHHKAL
ncbi:hypothetical protein FALBO_1171 [Fusarium albosuccineum]|uniref:Uncharacterized protein n=1 Tax=Fusarium albosuccineum TaxID=1237068 RepID=A0A8H4PM34_9HYPO|nr:hypothetical protein FALBO_1171 [Fusarium albosuccineum]